MITPFAQTGSETNVPPTVAYAILSAKNYAQEYGHLPGAVDELLEMMLPIAEPFITEQNFPAVEAYLASVFTDEPAFDSHVAPTDEAAAPQESK